MANEYLAPGLESYLMSYHEPHASLEPLSREIEVVDAALSALVSAGILPHKEYDRDKFLAHREAVRRLFEIPWTAITPRAQRLIYAINAIHKPRIMLAAGVFCGNTFISNAGAAVGPGAVYTADSLIGIEINAKEAALAERNTRKLDPSGIARVVAGDAVEFVHDFGGEIDLLYLDPDGPGAGVEGIYYDVVEAAYDKLSTGAIALAHNSHNAADTHQGYLDFVRSDAYFRASMNVVLDIEGLEVSVK